VELDQFDDACFFEELKTAVSKPRCLMGIDDDVARVGLGAGEQASHANSAANAVPETNLDRAARFFAFYPLPQRFPPTGSDRDREQAVDRAVQSGPQRGDRRRSGG
jgi:hypothetical protein